MTRELADKNATAVVACDSHLQALQLVAEARLCCDAFALGIDSLLIRQTVPAALAELTALKRMAERSADAMMALQAALNSNIWESSEPADQQCSVQLEIAFKALEFYADSDNYNRRAANKPSPITVDKGRIARDAIEAISGEIADALGSEGQE